MCPATTDFKVIKDKKCAFKGVEEEIKVIGVNTCGGCPGKKAVTRAGEMVKRGANLLFWHPLSQKVIQLALPSSRGENEGSNSQIIG